MKKCDLSSKYCIVGIGEAGLGTAEAGQTALSLQGRAAQRALLDCGLAPRDVDAVIEGSDRFDSDERVDWIVARIKEIEDKHRG